MIIIKKRNQMAMSVVICTTALIIIGWTGASVVEFAFSQSEGKKETNSMTKQKPQNNNSVDELQDLIDLLSDKQGVSSTVKLEAIEKLGMISDERAIHVLIEHIGLERKFKPRQKPYPGTLDHWDDPKPIPTRFPAVAALFKIGKASVPALLKLIEDNPDDAVESQNALFTVHLIFRDDLSKAVERLIVAFNNSITYEKQSRLSIALEKTRRVMETQERNQ